MLHLLGVQLPDRKIVSIALTSFYGIGRHTATAICNRLHIHPRCKLHELSEHQLTLLSADLSSSAVSGSGGAAGNGPLLIESDLKREIRANVVRLRSIGCYRGRRHAAGLPVRGQRTRTNAKNAKKFNGRWLRDSNVSSGSGGAAQSGRRSYSSMSSAARPIFEQ